MDNQRRKQAYRLAITHYWQEARREWRFTLPTLIFTGVGTILVFYVPPLIIAKLFAKYRSVELPAVSELTPYLLAFAGLWLLGEAFWRLSIYFMIKAETRSLKRLYIKGLEALLEKDLGFFHSNFAGSLTKKTTGYATRYIDVMDGLMYDVSPSVIPLLFIGAILWQFSPWLVVGLIGWVSLTVLLITPLIRRRKMIVDKREAASNKVSGYIADTYANIDAVRAFGREDYERANHRANVSKLVRLTKRTWDFQNWRIDTIISPMYVSANVFGFVLALHIASATHVSVETVFVTFSYFATFTRFMWEFNGIYRRLETSMSDAAQFTELLLDEPALKDVDRPEPLHITHGTIEFRNVDFHYQDNAHQELFDRLDLTIAAGEKVGLVGHSGGGKTTLTKLLLRFMDLDSGQILIDGQDIAGVKQSELRQQIAYVPQDPYLFHRTIAENIRYGKLEASDAEVKEAARLSHSDEFIRQLPDQYDTLIGERGVKLSGGQRQRVAIARAMIKNAPILLLDEATSALDSESERLIQDALWKLMEGRTAIVIAHRLSTIQKMDRIIVLEEGKVIEQGSHRELLDRNGIYANLWTHQSGGFIDE